MDLYRENLLDHYKNPRNFGKPDWKEGTVSEEVNPSCGDKIGLALKFSEDKVVDVRFWGEGCVVSMAAASMLTEYIKQKERQDIEEMKGEDVLTLLGGREMIPPARLRCAFLGLEALRKALGVKKGAGDGVD